MGCDWYHFESLVLKGTGYIINEMTDSILTNSNLN
jgi:hypothetical protein